jgi:hypothetical protein
LCQSKAAQTAAALFEEEEGREIGPAGMGSRRKGRTYFHIGALCLQQLTDDLAQLISIRQLSHGGQLRPCGVLRRWAHI